MALNTNVKFIEIEQVNAMNINKLVSFIEVRKVVFDMVATKALGSDGFPTLFY